MSEFQYNIKIPKERIAVLIGKKGEVKKTLEGETGTKILVDSKEGDVIVQGEDALYLYSLKEIIRAIARGFNPEIAQLLLKQDYAFEIIELKNISRPSQMKRIKGRVIGKNGRTREILEEHTDTNISVYGKTIAIIGRIESVNISKKAIEMLLKGSQHATVYRWLERMRSSGVENMSNDEFNKHLRHKDEEKKDSEDVDKENMDDSEEILSED
ncbi:RNA-processing protein [archaeon]|jgi:ribosomal RNA assembly protein|nr:RNA-processing protein [archaeon]MBT4648422.1 RNA-processing protein [archaeon]MBT6821771.1 RNA-processing protein [archaeon]MBT7391539.1 RNA-processing protein [archaeon]